MEQPEKKDLLMHDEVLSHDEDSSYETLIDSTNSEKKRWHNEGPERDVLIGFHCFWWTFSKIICDNLSISKIKRYVSARPCLAPTVPYSPLRLSKSIDNYTFRLSRRPTSSN